MQRLKLPLLLFAAIATVFMACKKEPLRDAVEPTGILKTGERPSGKDCYKGVRIKCGMLSFTDQAHFQEVYDCLEAAYEAHLDGFEAQYGYLSEDDYNDMADQLGFVDEQPLIDFEEALGFTSWRADYDLALNIYMDAGGDPELFTRPYLFGDAIAGTLRNKHGAVMINGRIFLLDDQYRAWSFCFCEMYEAYLANPSAFEDIEEDDCVGRQKTEYQGSGFTCRNHWKSCWWENIGDDRKVNQNLSFYYGSPSPGGSTQAMVEMRAFKKKWGKWRLRRIWMKVRVSGVSRDIQCDQKDNSFLRDKGYRWNRRIWRIQGWGEERTFIDDEIKGQFWYTTSGTTNNRSLNHLYNGCN